jgi:hypothetical protein
LPLIGISTSKARSFSTTPASWAAKGLSKRLGSAYCSGRSADWIKVKNPATPAVKRKAEKDWSTLGKRSR